MRTPPMYPKGDLRRLVVVLAAIDEGHDTLVKIAARTGLDKKTITSLVDQAREQAGVDVSKAGAVYAIDDWGALLKRAGAKKVLQGALNAPTI